MKSFLVDLDITMTKTSYKKPLEGKYETFIAMCYMIKLKTSCFMMGCPARKYHLWFVGVLVMTYHWCSYRFLTMYLLLYFIGKIDHHLMNFCINSRRYVYRFVCDLQSLLGYSPEELHRMLDVKPEDKMTGD